MPDNVFPEAVVAAASFAFRTDDLGSAIQAPVTKILLGGDGTDDGFVSSSNPLPISVATIPSHPVTNAGTFAVQAAQSGTWIVTGTGGTFPVTDSGGSLTVDAPVGTPVFVRLSDGTSAITTLPVTATQAGTWNVTNTGTFAVQAAQSGTWTVTGTGGTFPVTDSGGSLTVDAPVGTPVFVRLSDGTSAITSLQTTGSTAHDAVDANNPIKIGARAISTPSTNTSVAAADRTDVFAGLDGILLTRQHATIEDTKQARTTNTDGASTAFTGELAAPGAGVRLCITAVTVCNSSANFCTVDLRDGTAGSVLWTLPVPASGGVVQTFNPPLKLSANTALAFDASAATTTLTISANGFVTRL